MQLMRAIFFLHLILLSLSIESVLNDSVVWVYRPFFVLFWGFLHIEHGERRFCSAAHFLFCGLNDKVHLDLKFLTFGVHFWGGPFTNPSCHHLIYNETRNKIHLSIYPSIHHQGQGQRKTGANPSWFWAWGRDRTPWTRHQHISEWTRRWTTI